MDKKSVELHIAVPRLKAFALPNPVNSNRSPRRMYHHTHTAITPTVTIQHSHTDTACMCKEYTPMNIQGCNVLQDV